MSEAWAVASRRVHLRVRGIVQGVFYRATTRDQARALGLLGTVCNLPDGSVEVIAEGPEAALVELEGWCRRGPPGARVDSVETTWADARGEFDRFRITR